MCSDWDVSWTRMLEGFSNTFYDKSILPPVREICEEQLLAIYMFARSLFGFTNHDEGMMSPFHVLSNTKACSYRCVFVTINLRAHHNQFCTFCVFLCLAWVNNSNFRNVNVDCTPEQLASAVVDGQHYHKLLCDNVDLITVLPNDVPNKVRPVIFSMSVRARDGRRCCLAHTSTVHMKDFLSLRSTGMTTTKRQHPPRQQTTTAANINLIERQSFNAQSKHKARRMTHQS